MVSAFGGNSVQIGGPTGAFIVIVAGIITEFGLTGLAVATFMAGIIRVLMGLFRLGTVVKFIPYPVVVGFTAGIALTYIFYADERLFRPWADRRAERFVCVEAIPAKLPRMGMNDFAAGTALAQNDFRPNGGLARQ